MEIFFLFFLFGVFVSSDELWQTYNARLDQPNPPKWWKIPVECNMEILHEQAWEQRFKQEFQGQKPAILRGWSSPAFDELKKKLTKSALLSEFGRVKVFVCSQEELIASGVCSHRSMSLSKYVKSSMGKNVYLFDKEDFMNSTGLGKNWTLPPGFRDGNFDSWPHDIGTVRGVYPNPHLTIAIGGDSNGIGLHYHRENFNVLFHGSKRWVIYSPKDGMRGVRFKPNENLLSWLQKHRNHGPPPTWECIQEEGDILYVPDAFYHATASLGESVTLITPISLIATITLIGGSGAAGMDEGTLFQLPQRVQHLARRRKVARGAPADPGVHSEGGGGLSLAPGSFFFFIHSCIHLIPSFSLPRGACRHVLGSRRPRHRHSLPAGGENTQPLG